MKTFIGLALLALAILLPCSAWARLTSITLKPTTVVNGTAAVGTVTLNHAAPPGGTTVTVTSLNLAVVPVSYVLVVPEGSLSLTFNAPTNAVTTSTSVAIQAQEGSTTRSATLTVLPREPVRGVAGDGWADVIVGKPGFGEITPNETTSARVFHVGGTLVDTTAHPNRIYVYDGGNSRVLGMSHLGACASSGADCTTDLDCPGSSCTIHEGIGADLVLGQPSSTTSACNGDGAYQRYPVRAPASAASLCSMPDNQISVLEGGSFANLAVDAAGNLYVPDWDNHRVLRYDSPYTTDAIADHVWGQADFTANDCNRGRGMGFPDDRSLCLRSPLNEGFTGGVAVDAIGNLYVTDNQNNRLLRFPWDPGAGAAAPIADLVLGQPDFSSSDKGAGLDRMWAPQAVRVDASGAVYVVDSQPGGGGDVGGRVLVFHPPLFSGMPAQELVSGLRNPTGIELDPATGGIWVNDSSDNQYVLYVGGVATKVLFKDVPVYDGGCGHASSGDGPQFFYTGNQAFVDSFNVCGSYGGIGVDEAGNVFGATWSWQDTWRFPAPIPEFPLPVSGQAHSADARLFEDYQFGYPNHVTLSSLDSPRGVAVGACQLVTSEAWRLLFWNDPRNLTTPRTADGWVGTSDPLLTVGPTFGRIREDRSGHLWAIRDDTIVAYSLPLSTGAFPTITIASPLPVAGGGSLSWDTFLTIGGLAPDATSSVLWVAAPLQSRVFRIRDPLTAPVVDIVLGQADLGGTVCNQGRGDPQAGGTPTADSLCNPAGIALDRDGNLYVSDHSLEVAGNHRLLEFDASLFPANPAAALFGIPASRVYGRGGSFTEPFCYDRGRNLYGVGLCGPLEPALASNGALVVGQNGYLGSHFPLVFEDPLASDEVDGYLDDFYSYAYSAVFDSRDDLYLTDLDRGRVLVYRNPFSLPVETTAPSSIADLAATPLSDSSVELTWTATGDDGASGTAVRYDLRRSVAPILDEADFQAAMPVPGVPAPHLAGSPEQLTVTGLPADTAAYFALEAYDDVCNLSTLSNDAGAVTAPAGSMLPPTHLVISQIRTAGAANDGIELYNPTPSPIPLTSHSVQYLRADGTFGFSASLTGANSVPAHGFYLVAANGYVGPPARDDSLGTSNLSGVGGHALLVGKTAAVSGCADPAIVDKVGYGTTATCPEGGPGHATSAPTGAQSVTRKPGGASGSGQDTDVNDADFLPPAPPLFHDRFSAPATPPAPLGNVDDTLFLSSAGVAGTRLDWARAWNAGLYHVYRGTTPGFLAGNPVPWATVPATTVTDSAAPSPIFFYVVRATDGTADSSN